ncbi:MAG: hypothetical protein ACM3NH_03835 [Candidatus Saccharibacteria bacterium]
MKTDVCLLSQDLIDLTKEIAPDRSNGYHFELFLPASLVTGSGINPDRLRERKFEFIRLACLNGLIHLAGRGDLAHFCQKCGDIEMFGKVWQIGVALGIWKNRAEDVFRFGEFLEKGFPAVSAGKAALR